MATEPFSIPAAISIPRIGRAPARKATACSTICSITSRTSASGRCGSRSRTPCARVSAPIVPTGPADLAAVHDEFMRHILPYRHRQRASRLHGLGAWRRQRARHAGGDARRRAQRQSRRPRPRADRSRAADRALDAPAVRISRARRAGCSSPARRWPIFIGVLVARTRALGVEVRRDGVAAAGKRLVAYASAGRARLHFARRWICPASAPRRCMSFRRNEHCIESISPRSTRRSRRTAARG